MAGKYIQDTSAALTANGGSNGYVTVTNNSIVLPGCRVYLYSSTTGSQLCEVTDLSGTTLIGLRFLNEDDRKNVPQYGVKSDCSAFTTANSATLYVPSQVVDEWNAYKKL